MRSDCGEAQLRLELEAAQAKIRDLQQRLFGRKSERRKDGNEQPGQALVAPAARGHQRGALGHGRTMQTHLPERSEWVALDAPRCPNCGLALSLFPGSEDSEVLEIEVQAYRRVIRRRRYRPGCECGCVPGIVTAPPPARLIERGKFGISVWASVLLDKLLYGRPSHRLLQDLSDHGLNTYRQARWPAACMRWHRCSSRSTKRWWASCAANPTGMPMRRDGRCSSTSRVRSAIAGTCGCFTPARWFTTCSMSHGRPQWSKPS